MPPLQRHVARSEANFRDQLAGRFGAQLLLLTGIVACLHFGTVPTEVSSYERPGEEEEQDPVGGANWSDQDARNPALQTAPSPAGEIS